MLQVSDKHELLSQDGGIGLSSSFNKRVTLILFIAENLYQIYLPNYLVHNLGKQLDYVCKLRKKHHHLYLKDDRASGIHSKKFAFKVLYQGFINSGQLKMLFSCLGGIWSSLIFGYSVRNFCFSLGRHPTLFQQSKS